MKDKWDFRTEDGKCAPKMHFSQESCVRCKGIDDLVSNDTLLPGFDCTYWRREGNKCDWPNKKY